MKKLRVAGLLLFWLNVICGCNSSPPKDGGEDAAFDDGQPSDSGASDSGDVDTEISDGFADDAFDAGQDSVPDGGTDGHADVGQHPCQPGTPVSENILDKYEMIIVTAPTLVRDFEVLADWKRLKGVPTLVVDTDTIGRNMSGTDLAAKIREFIRLKKQEGAKWVLLGGDAEVVPPRVVHCRALAQFDEYFASDFYYSDLDGTWDKNGNGVYGEVADECEMHPDIAVGRLPVANTEQAQAAINKILSYELNDLGTTLRALFISEDTGFLNFDSALQLEPLANNVFPARFQKQKLYWKWQSYSGATENTLAAQVQALEDGCNLVTHYGHASEQNLNMEMTAATVDNLNNLPYFPVYVSCGRMAGRFDYPSMDTAGERLITNPNGGAVAYLGNANYGLGPGGGTALIEAFYKALFGGTTNIGAALMVARNNFYSQESNLDNELLGIRWTQFVVVLFADPEMEVRIEEPKKLQISHPDVLASGEQCLEVAVSKEGQPVAGATVTAYRRSGFLYRQKTDASGRTVFRFTNESGGTIDIAATLSQHLPVLSSVDAL